MANHSRFIELCTNTGLQPVPWRYGKDGSKRPNTSSLNSYHERKVDRATIERDFSTADQCGASLLSLEGPRPLVMDLDCHGDPTDEDLNPVARGVWEICRRHNYEPWIVQTRNGGFHFWFWYMHYDDLPPTLKLNHLTYAHWADGTEMVGWMHGKWQVLMPNNDEDNNYKWRQAPNEMNDEWVFEIATEGLIAELNTYARSLNQDTDDSGDGATMRAVIPDHDAREIEGDRDALPGVIAGKNQELVKAFFLNHGWTIARDWCKESGASKMPGWHLRLYRKGKKDGSHSADYWLDEQIFTNCSKSCPFFKRVTTDKGYSAPFIGGVAAVQCDGDIRHAARVLKDIYAQFGRGQGGQVDFEKSAADKDASIRVADGYSVSGAGITSIPHDLAKFIEPAKHAMPPSKYGTFTTKRKVYSGKVIGDTLRKMGTGVMHKRIVETRDLYEVYCFTGKHCARYSMDDFARRVVRPALIAMGMDENVCDTGTIRGVTIELISHDSDGDFDTVMHHKTAQRDVIALHNGTLNVAENTFTESWERDDYLLNVLPFDYDPEATCPRFDQFLQKQLPPIVELDDEDNPIQDIEPDNGTQRMLQEYIGRLLLLAGKYNNQKIPILEGRHGNEGKGAVLTIVEHVLGGDNCSSLNLKTICGTQCRFQRPRMFQKIVNICWDEKDPHFTDGEWQILRKMASGEPLEFDRKHGTPFMSSQYGQLVVAANQAPFAKGPHDMRRLAVIP